MEAWHEVKVKVLSTVAAAVAIGLGAFAWNWAATNIVFASDLEGLADMIAIQLRAEIRPLSDALEETNKLAQQNARDIKQGRADATRAAIRDLVASIRELENRRDEGEQWTQSDALLLEEWKRDVEDLQRQLSTLESVQ